MHYAECSDVYVPSTDLRTYPKPLASTHPTLPHTAHVHTSTHTTWLPSHPTPTANQRKVHRRRPLPQNSLKEETHIFSINGTDDAGSARRPRAYTRQVEGRGDSVQQGNSNQRLQQVGTAVDAAFIRHDHDTSSGSLFLPLLPSGNTGAPKPTTTIKHFTRPQQRLESENISRKNRITPES